VLVWEKTPSGQRVRKLHDAPHYFYQRDPKGAFLTTTGVTVAKVEFSTTNDFDQAVADCQMRRIPIFESDISPLERVLMDIYSTKPAPELLVGLLDIEVDYDPSIGYAGPSNPYAPINAVSISIGGEMATIAVPPKSWDWDNDFLPEDLAAVILVKTEKELLELLLDCIHPCDVLSGWNSEFYDLPYIARRVELILGKHVLDRLSFEGGPSPRWTEKARFKHAKEKEPVIDLETRVHLDYLRLFQKFDLTKRQSYSLDNVSFEELNEKKVSYDGSLSELYNNDFVKFVRYNIHDVTLLVRLDAKFKYIELANQMAHMASVNFSSIFGSVQLIDTAIMNFAHNVKKLIVNDRNVRPEADPVEGAIVVTPNVGFYKWIGACDINSLYPSTIRSLNLSLEKLVGQLYGPSDSNAWVDVPVRTRKTLVVAKKYTIICEVQRNETTTRAKWTYYDDASGQIEHVNVRYGDRSDNDTSPQDDAVYDGYEYAWRVYHHVSNDPSSKFAGFMIDVKFDSDNQVMALPLEALCEYVKDNKLAVSAFGTILDQGNGPGLVPEVLSSWFMGRKEMQAEKKKYGKLKQQLLDEGKSDNDPEVVEAKRLETYYDMLQGVRKVLLNSTYGAMLNEYSRFGDGRIGASVTYTGRQITTHMVNMVSKGLAPEGQAPVLVKFFKPETKKDAKTGTDGLHDLRWGQNFYEIAIEKGSGPIYGDTDSVYFTYENIVKGIDDVDVIVEAANAIADDTNRSFPAFMREAFNCQPGFDGLIKANRELVCRTGVIQAKKKYMMAVVDKEGKRIKLGDDDELKTMGSDIKLSSTPELIREMLTEVVMKILNEQPKKLIDEVVIKFREAMSTSATDQINPLDLATVVSVNGLDEAWTLWDRIERRGMQKVKIAANARSAINHNYMLEHFNVKSESPIKSGDKIKLVWLLENEFGFTNMAFTSETEVLPSWFTAVFQVDRKLMEEKLVDNKLELIFKPLGWEVPTFQTQLIDSLLDF
jgi:DNA polymerase elongation subunit (family B)